MKIDKIEQTVCTKNINLVQQIKTKDFTLTPIGNNLAKLKTNPGKIINRSLNLGTIPIVAELINLEIIQSLKVTPRCLNKIEYCIDVKVPFKLIENKHIINSFYKTIGNFNYKKGKLDVDINSSETLKKSSWKGIKGYKSSRTIKLYSKYEEKNIKKDYDLIRLEITFGSRAIFQNKISSISDIQLARKELYELLVFCEKNYLKTLNRYSKNTKYLVEKLKEELKKETL